MTDFFKKILLIFILAFAFNFIWEHYHALLYVHYKGKEITQLILARAALFDASFITLVSVFFLKFDYLRQRQWLIIIFGTAFAIGLEWYALATGRWMYKDIMPIIPFINTGLTPTVQLGFLGYFAFKLVNKKYEK